MYQYRTASNHADVFHRSRLGVHSRRRHIGQYSRETPCAPRYPEIARYPLYSSFQLSIYERFVGEIPPRLHSVVGRQDLLQRRFLIETHFLSFPRHLALQNISGT